jgi:hypothetical protein
MECGFFFFSGVILYSYWELMNSLLAYHTIANKHIQQESYEI